MSGRLTSPGYLSASLRYFLDKAVITRIVDSANKRMQPKT
jgi:hypothetical protein